MQEQETLMMSYQFDLSHFINTFKRHVLVAIDVNEILTVENVVQYVFNSISFDYTGLEFKKVQLFDERNLFVPLCQPSAVLQNTTGMLRVSYEDDSYHAKISTNSRQVLNILRSENKEESFVLSEIKEHNPKQASNFSKTRITPKQNYNGQSDFYSTVQLSWEQTSELSNKNSENNAPKIDNDQSDIYSTIKQACKQISDSNKCSKNDASKNISLTHSPNALSNNLDIYSKPPEDNALNTNYVVELFNNKNNTGTNVTDLRNAKPNSSNLNFSRLEDTSSTQKIRNENRIPKSCNSKFSQLRESFSTPNASDANIIPQNCMVTRHKNENQTELKPMYDVQNGISNLTDHDNFKIHKLSDCSISSIESLISKSNSTANKPIKRRRKHKKGKKLRENSSDYYTENFKRNKKNSYGRNQLFNNNSEFQKVESLEGERNHIFFSEDEDLNTEKMDLEATDNDTNSENNKVSELVKSYLKTSTSDIFESEKFDNKTECKKVRFTDCIKKNESETESDNSSESSVERPTLQKESSAVGTKTNGKNKYSRTSSSKNDGDKSMNTEYRSTLVGFKNTDQEIYKPKNLKEFPKEDKKSSNNKLNFDTCSRKINNSVQNTADVKSPFKNLLKLENYFGGPVIYTWDRSENERTCQSEVSLPTSFAGRSTVSNYKYSKNKKKQSESEKRTFEIEKNDNRLVNNCDLNSLNEIYHKAYATYSDNQVDNCRDAVTYNYLTKDSCTGYRNLSKNREQTQEWCMNDATDCSTDLNLSSKHENSATSPSRPLTVMNQPNTSTPAIQTTKSQMKKKSKRIAHSLGSMLNLLKHNGKAEGEKNEHSYTEKEKINYEHSNNKKNHYNCDIMCENQISNPERINADSDDTNMSEIPAEKSLLESNGEIESCASNEHFNKNYDNDNNWFAQLEFEHFTPMHSKPAAGDIIAAKFKTFQDTFEFRPARVISVVEDNVTLRFTDQYGSAEKFGQKIIKTLPWQQLKSLKSIFP